MKFQNKGAVLVQIALLFISQPCNQNQSILSASCVRGVRMRVPVAVSEPVQV